MKSIGKSSSADRLTPFDRHKLPMDQRQTQLRRNLEVVNARIANAAEKANRNPSDVQLIAVTKYVDEGVTRDLVEVGCHHLGESRPQALWNKAEALSDLSVSWHQIGHLQRNKLRRTMPLVSLVHSVDSARLLAAIDELQSVIDPDTPKAILLEVNTSGDETKHGFQLDCIAQAVEASVAMKHVELRGLMCMAGFGTNQDEARRDFAKLRSTRDSLQEQFSNEDLSELSMGMSSDFEAAILEGATMVRLGSMLFEGTT